MRGRSKWLIKTFVVSWKHWKKKGSFLPGKDANCPPQGSVHKQEDAMNLYRNFTTQEQIDLEYNFSLTVPDVKDCADFFVGVL
jgi:hypothetical protein